MTEQEIAQKLLGPRCDATIPIIIERLEALANGATPDSYFHGVCNDLERAFHSSYHHIGCLSADYPRAQDDHVFEVQDGITGEMVLCCNYPVPGPYGMDARVAYDSPAIRNWSGEYGLERMAYCEWLAGRLRVLADELRGKTT